MNVPTKVSEYLHKCVISGRENPIYIYSSQFCHNGKCWWHWFGCWIEFRGSIASSDKRGSIASSDKRRKLNLRWKLLRRSENSRRGALCILWGRRGGAAAGGEGREFRHSQVCFWGQWVIELLCIVGLYCCAYLISIYLFEYNTSMHDGRGTL